MSIRNIAVTVVPWKDLSVAIKDEMADMGKCPERGILFWVKVPSSVKELEESPNWAEYCRGQDIGVTHKVLVET